LIQAKNDLLIGAGDLPCHILGQYANRHGLIAGATGTGKTVTLQVLAEGFSRIGVPVFLADVKGDLSGLCQAGSHNKHIQKRIDHIQIKDYRNEAYPVIFWDLQGQHGHPARTTISEMGPLLLSRLLDLNNTQEGVLNIAFAVADDEGMLLLDLKDLRAMLNFVSEQRKSISQQYGNVSPASVGAIQRRLLVLEQAGAEQFFGEPALALEDLMRQDMSGNGMLNVLDARSLILNPKLYSTFLLWLMSELFEQLPEVGDAERPKMVFFFDEAHLLFNDAPKALLEKVEQVVRLIRSKGVGIYFVTQNPSDIPDTVLGQLGNRIQHALRAYTPKDRKNVKAAAQNFVPNPKLDVERILTDMGVGEALVSTLGEGGIPSMVERCLVAPPRSTIGPAKTSNIKQMRQRSPVGDQYDQSLDRESAFEQLKQRANQKLESEKQASSKKTQKKTRKRQSVWETAIKSAARSMATQFGRTLVRGILGSLSKGR